MDVTIISRLMETDFWAEKRVDFWKLVKNMIIFIHWTCCYKHYYFYRKSWHKNTRMELQRCISLHNYLKPKSFIFYRIFSLCLTSSEWRYDSTLHCTITCSHFKSMTSTIFSCEFSESFQETTFLLPLDACLCAEILWYVLKSLEKYKCAEL